ncbi:MAG: amidase [Alphaproteobacteria bacterium]|nr:amidase [Alphaproteobacteria bacterium]
MSADVPAASLVATAARIRGREVSSEEVVGAAIQRAEALQPDLNCFIALEAEAALDAARDIDRRLAAGEAVGPLAGVPLAHKDMYYRQGKISTCGSSIRREVVAGSTATVLTRLEAAGAVHLGNLNMSEFAVGPLGHNDHFGACRNPWNTDHAPGGSSSGSGSVVAAGIVGGALGSDTGGSIRIPASFSGVVGLKPTQTRVSRHGLMPLSFSFDCAGPLARTVRDAARVLGVIAGADPADPTASRQPVADYEAACGAPVAGLRLGLPTSYYDQGLTPEVAAALAAARRQFADLGVELVEVPVPDHDEINMLWTVGISAEAATIHRRWLRERPGDYGAQIRRRIEIGLYQPATRYLEAMSLRQDILADFMRQAFDRADALLIPGTPLPAPTLAETDIGDDDEMPALILKISAMTRPISFLGLPSLCLPSGFTESGLPLSMQLVGRPFDEARLFRLGAAYEDATDWHRRLPPLAQGARP